MNTVNLHHIVHSQPVVVKPSAHTEAAKKAVQAGAVPVAGDSVTERQVSTASGKSVPSDQSRKNVDSTELNQAVSDLNQYIQNVQRDLQFSVDKDSGRTVIKVIDSESKETIRQIPPEEALAVAKALKENLEASLLKVEA